MTLLISFFKKKYTCLEVCVWVKSCGLGFTPVFGADWAFSVSAAFLGFSVGKATPYTVAAFVFNLH